MKIVIVGPGALGLLLAAYLKHKTKDEVWLLDKSDSRARSLRASGVRVEGLGGSLRARIPITATASDIGAVDLIILCVKGYATDEACKACASLIGPRTRVLSLQNGIGNMQVMNDHFGPDRVIMGVTSHGSTLIGDGHVRHAGKGETIIGTTDGRVLGDIRTVAATLTRAGFDTRISKDIGGVIWSKLIVNAGINAVAAITRLTNGALLSSEEARAVMRSAVQEAVRVAKRKRVKLLYDDALQKVETVCAATAANRSSMLQDVLRRKRTEVEHINGAIVRQGKALGIQTPVNEVLASLVRALETGKGA